MNQSICLDDEITRLFQNYILTTEIDLSRIPIAATFAAPGRGKTHFLDQFLNSGEKFSQVLQNRTFIPLYISLNDFTEVTIQELNSPRDVIMSRLLYKYIIIVPKKKKVMVYLFPTSLSQFRRSNKD